MKKRSIYRIITAIVLSSVLAFCSVIIPSDITPVTSVEAASEKLSAPTGIETKAYSDEIFISWDEVRNATGYRIYRLNTSTNKWGKWKDIDESIVPSVKVEGLKDNKVYYFKIAALKNGKPGKKTSSISVKTMSKSEAAEINKATFELYKNITLPEDRYKGACEKSTTYTNRKDTESAFVICVEDERTMNHFYDEIQQTAKRSGYKVVESYGKICEVYDSKGNEILWVQKQSPDKWGNYEYKIHVYFYFY